MSLLDQLRQMTDALMEQEDTVGFLRDMGCREDIATRVATSKGTLAARAARKKP